MERELHDEGAARGTQDRRPRRSSADERSGTSVDGGRAGRFSCAGHLYRQQFVLPCRAALHEFELGVRQLRRLGLRVRVDERHSGRGDGGRDQGFQFGHLSCDLVDLRGLDRFKAKVYVYFATFVLFRRKHLRQCRALLKRAVDAATDAGDLTYKAYGLRSLISNMMSSGEPLADVEQEAHATLQFMRELHFGLAADSLLRR